MRKTTSRKGISMLLAALLLVVIVVIASVIIYAWSTGLLGSLMPGSPSVKEGLSMDSYNCSTTVAELYIRNVGTSDVTLESSLVEEGGTALTGPTAIVATPSSTIPVNTWVKVSVTYSFQSGHSYTIKLITTKGTQFTFNVVAT